MSKSDWLEIGLKLLGTYFIIVAIAALWRTTLTLMNAPVHSRGMYSALLFPLVELAAGIVLVRLRWNLPDPSRRKEEPLPEFFRDESLGRMEQGEGPKQE